MNWSTHDVTNVVRELQDYNLYATDLALQEGVRRAGGGAHEAELSAYGAALGSAETIRLAEEANHFKPELHTFDRQGRRIDRVEFHPSWHAIMRMAREQNLVAQPFADPRPGAWAAYAAGFSMHGQIEAGSQCPNSMTFACIPVLQREPELFAALQPKLYSRTYDARDIPLEQKDSILVGMGMTEKQGGSDVRANTTRAEPLRGEGRGGEYLITGHKWFFSAPMCDAHLVVARLGAEDGPLSCFFVPRFRDDGSKNPIQIQRLKDKLGNRSNASTEVEFRGAEGILIGEEGRGIPTIIEMATHTRLDCVIGSAGLLRHALMQALHHARHRMAFGRLLADQPLMRNVLADLALESQAATLLMMELGSAFERAETDPVAAAWKRIVTPAAKFWVCKRTLEATGEAMEVWGGNGYVEAGPMARLYREAPVNSIWEGSGNVMCLDVLRAIGRTPDDVSRLLHDIGERAQSHRIVRAELAALQALLHQPGDLQETAARRIAQGVALTAQAALMVAHAHPDDAEHFIASRFHHEHGRVFGTLDGHAQALGAVLQRAWPV